MDPAKEVRGIALSAAVWWGWETEEAKWHHDGAVGDRVGGWEAAETNKREEWIVYDQGKEKRQRCNQDPKGL